jgi:hypothetical protein
VNFLDYIWEWTKYIKKFVITKVQTTSPEEFLLLVVTTVFGLIGRNNFFMFLSDKTKANLKCGLRSFIVLLLFDIFNKKNKGNDKKVKNEMNDDSQDETNDNSQNETNSSS